MARLRAANVEYRRCQECGTDYPGSRCPKPDCRAYPTPTTERLIKVLLIIEGDVIPHYERQERWRCPQCQHLYEPLCSACGMPPFTSQQIERTLAGTTSLLAQLRALKGQGFCAHCHSPLVNLVWCPCCRTQPTPPARQLPFSPTWVYVPTGAFSIPLDTLTVDRADLDEDDGFGVEIPDEPPEYPGEMKPDQEGLNHDQ